MKSLQALSCGILLCATPSAFADETRLTFSGTFQNLALFKTDSDFDSSKAAYEPDGQTAGILGTFLSPKFSYAPSERLSLVYEVEIGTNFWSRNRVDTVGDEVRDFFLFKHRQVYSEGYLTDRSTLRVGYQYLHDPTGLFLHHWVGGARLQVAGDENPHGILLAQFPDQTYEGFDINRNNFVNDVFLLGLTGSLQGRESRTMNGGLFTVYDGQTIGRHKWLVAPAISLNHGDGETEHGIDLLAQFGRTNHGAMGDRNEVHLAGAIQPYLASGLGRARLYQGPTGVSSGGAAEAAGSGDRDGWLVSALLLSPDDPYDRNGRNYAFHYSGRARGRSLLLTENELRDFGDNLDERIGERSGPFTIVRGGMALIEGSYFLRLSDAMTLSAVLAGAGVLQEANALGKSLIGLEGDVGLSYSFSESFVLEIQNALLVPGGAAGAFVNAIDAGSSRPVYMLEVSLAAFF